MPTKVVGQTIRDSLARYLEAEDRARKVETAARWRPILAAVQQEYGFTPAGLSTLKARLDAEPDAGSDEKQAGFHELFRIRHALRRVVVQQTQGFVTPRGLLRLSTMASLDAHEQRLRQLDVTVKDLYALTVYELDAGSSDMEDPQRELAAAMQVKEAAVAALRVLAPVEELASRGEVTFRPVELRPGRTVPAAFYAVTSGEVAVGAPLDELIDWAHRNRDRITGGA